MAIVDVVHPGGAATPIRATIQAAVDANPGKYIRLPGTISTTWTLDGRAGDANQDTPDALGTVEMGENQLIVGNGVTVVESSATPFPGTWQSAFRWLNKTLFGVILEAGARVTGRRDLHVGGDEWRAAFKLVSTGNSQQWQDFVGNSEAHVTGWKGDGFFIQSGDAVTGGNHACKKIRVLNVNFNDNNRHGVTIEDVNGFRWQNVGGSGNDGTGSSHLCDIEPDNTGDSLIDIELDGGTFDAHAVGISIDLEQLNGSSSPVDVLIKNMICNQSADPSDDPWAYRFKNSHDGPPSGTVEYRNCYAADLRYAALRAQWRLSSGVLAKFNGCVSHRCATTFEKPINLDLVGSPTGAGILIDDVVVEETLDRVVTLVASSGGNATNVRGRAFVDRGGLKMSTSQLQTLLPNLNVQRYTKQHKSRHRIALEREALRSRELLPRVDFGREA